MASAAPLDRFVAFFEGMTEADVARLGEVYTDDARFCDPFSDVRGLDRIRAIFAGMFEGMRDYALKVDEATADGDMAWIRWTMSGRVRQLGPSPWVVHGVSVIRFAGDGRVREHVDFWDAASQMYERIPVIGWILARIRRRIGKH